MHYLGEIQGAVEKKEGTYLKVFIPGDHIVNKITRYKVGNIVKTEVRIDDGRRITNEQRKKYFATLQDICECLGYDLDYMHALFKVKYCIMNGVEKISISNCSVTQARELINMLMDFSIEEGIPLRELGALRTDDIDRFLYKCLITRTCCITGRKEADIHHVDAVGMGRNRNKVSHKGLRLIALSREWHIRVHQEGMKEIFDKYKIYGLVIDDIGLKQLKLSKNDVQEECNHGENGKNDKELL